MPGSATPTAPDRATVPRFGGTERALHWVHAAAFFALLGTGLVLYLPSLAAHVGNRPLVKAVHLGVAAGWLTALGVIALAGDRRAWRYPPRKGRSPPRREPSRWRIAPERSRSGLQLE